VLTGHELTETRRLEQWADQMDELSAELARREIDASILSENWIAGEIFRTIERDAPILVVGTLAVVFLVLLVDFRKVRAAAVVISPVLIGLVCLAGALRLSGVELNFMNSGILPVCVGISLDNSIHVYRRWREDGPGSIPLVLRQTSVANLLSSATNMMGFGALLVAHHGGLRSVAWLAILGVTCTYLTTSVAFPLALQTFERLREGATRPADAH
jgi:predicted RND superfamily exporter protein